MKTLKLFFLIAIPVILFSCNSRTSNKKNDNMNKNRERKETKRDTVNRGSMMFSLGSIFQDNKDEDFVKEAASGGMMEVELGKYAEENALNPRVKKFGSMMVKDHSKANDELKSVASKKGITLSGSMEDSHRDKTEDLKKEKGADFDKAYMKNMVDDHEKDIKEFQKEAENGKDDDVKTFATKTLPTLLVHLDSAKAIRDDLK